MTGVKIQCGEVEETSNQNGEAVFSFHSQFGKTVVCSLKDDDYYKDVSINYTFNDFKEHYVTLDIESRYVQSNKVVIAVASCLVVLVLVFVSIVWVKMEHDQKLKMRHNMKSEVYKET